MKLLASLLGVLALVVCLPGMGTAGDYHTGATLICSDCHVMHASQQHGYEPDGSGGYTTPVGTHDYLLRNEINLLCLGCHDAVPGTPDVYGADVNAAAGFQRQAGALNDVGGVDTYNEDNGHTLHSEDVAPGGTFQGPAGVGLECTNCHQPHGHNILGNAWRNLHWDPAGDGSAPPVLVDYATGAIDATKDVYQVAVGLVTTHYDQDNVYFNEPDITASAYGDFCKDCHKNFHGSPGDAEVGGVATATSWTNFIRHPGAGVDIGAEGGGHSSLAVWDDTGGAGKTNWPQAMSASGDWPNAPAVGGDRSDNTPSCMTCHKAHGNGNAFGLIFMSGTGVVTEEGDANGIPGPGDGKEGVKALCKQCHVQG